MRRAALLRAAGCAPEVATLAALPAPGATEVTVAMRRGPINPADLLMIDGGYAFAEAYPLMLGAEGVGEVTETGSAVVGLRPGDRVIPLSRGNWATHRRLDQNDVVRVPPGLTLDQAATLRINPATALRLTRLAPLSPGDWIVQNGAASMVARWVRAIAARRGICVIDLVRDGGRSLEVGHGLPDTEAAIAAAHERTAGAPIRLALDCVAGGASGRLAAMLAPRGLLAVFGHLSGAPCSIASTLLTAKGLEVRGFSLRPAEAADSHADLTRLYDELAALALAADLHPAVSALFPLADLPAAVARARRGGGRVMIALDA